MAGSLVYCDGEVAERFKAHAWKVCMVDSHPGFESLPLRHIFRHICSYLPDNLLKSMILLTKGDCAEYVPTSRHLIWPESTKAHGPLGYSDDNGLHPPGPGSFV